ncbi:hypothetical protein [Pedobacter miscanthi]|uniref:hypothetical protein n=1 Tax=Pedobacter miscanthi TaxID=2259170 RepID=UPI00292CD87F|nr:hypothetical protein [Pedobacter miscanthi]
MPKEQHPPFPINHKMFFSGNESAAFHSCCSLTTRFNLLHFYRAEARRMRFIAGRCYVPQHDSVFNHTGTNSSFEKKHSFNLKTVLTYFKLFLYLDATF